MLDFTCLDTIRHRRPLIHCVSNIVSANDCANLILAVGASPIMAQAAEEMEDITAASAATVLNTGTPDKAKFEFCFLCGRAARALDQPVVIDPVGVGASPWRLHWVNALMNDFTPSILRVNLGEAQALLETDSQAQGVDSPKYAIRESQLACARALAVKYQTTVLLSGAEDIIADNKTSYIVSGGSGLMSHVTGTGCMLSALCGTFNAVEQNSHSAAALSAAFWKICAKRAEAVAGTNSIGTFRTELMNAASALTTEEFAREAQKIISENL